MVALEMVNAGETSLADSTAEVLASRGFHGEDLAFIGEKKSWGKTERGLIEEENAMGPSGGEGG